MRTDPSPRALRTGPSRRAQMTRPCGRREHSPRSCPWRVFPRPHPPPPAFASLGQQREMQARRLINGGVCTSGPQSLAASPRASRPRRAGTFFGVIPAFCGFLAGIDLHIEAGGAAGLLHGLEDGAGELFSRSSVSITSNRATASSALLVCSGPTGAVQARDRSRGAAASGYSPPAPGSRQTHADPRQESSSIRVSGCNLGDGDQRHICAGPPAALAALAISSRMAARRAARVGAEGLDMTGLTYARSADLASAQPAAPLLPSPIRSARPTSSARWTPRARDGADLSPLRAG